MIKIEKLNKVYSNGCHALKDLSFEVKKGEFLAVIGLSGAGKSTLLRCLNRIHDISSGKILFNGKDIACLKGKEIQSFRSKIGMIFQNFNLIPRKSVLTNVLTGALSRTKILHAILGCFSAQEKKYAQEKIAIVGLSGKEQERADKLSGGEQQRVCIAKALVQNPLLILADEPVASLDPSTADSVMNCLKKMNKDFGVTIICNLHLLSLVRRYASSVIALKNGELVFEGKPEEISEESFKRIYGQDAVEEDIK